MSQCINELLRELNFYSLLTYLGLRLPLHYLQTLQCSNAHTGFQ